MRDLGLPLSAGSLALAARLELAGSDLIASLSPGYLALTFGKGKDALRLEGNTPKATLRSQFEDGELAPIQLDVSGGKLSSPSLGFAARGFQIDGKLELPWRFEGKLGVRELKDTRKPPRVPPVVLEGRLEPRKDELAFDLIAAESKRRVVWHAKGTFDPEARSADAQLKMEPVVFVKDGLQPAQLAPQLDGFVRSATGALEATGRARYAKGKPRLELDWPRADSPSDLERAREAERTVRVEGPGPSRPRRATVRRPDPLASCSATDGSGDAPRTA